MENSALLEGHNTRKNQQSQLLANSSKNMGGVNIKASLYRSLYYFPTGGLKPLKKFPPAMGLQGDYLLGK
jgi:hypothetical protein